MNVLFLDDNPDRTRAFRSLVPYGTCTTTAQECIDEMQLEDEWDFVFLDHDLGGEVYVDSDREDCGMEVVRWICANKPKIGMIVIHTHNPPAAIRMEIELGQADYQASRIPFCALPDWLRDMQI